MPNPNIIEFVDHPSIMRSSSLKLSPGLRPRRVVLRKLPGKFVTHYEHMRIRIEFRGKDAHFRSEREGYDVVVCEHEDFDIGHYFEFGEFSGLTEDQAKEKAIADFEERSKRF